MGDERRRTGDRRSRGRGSKQYAVKAVWRTLQGEGAWAGRPAVFVRLVGCNMWSGYDADRDRDAARTGADCPLWCDTDFTKEQARPPLRRCPRRAASAAPGGDIRFCVLTGGEPLLQVDAALVRALHAAGFEVAVETNGTVALADACTDADGSSSRPTGSCAARSCPRTGWRWSGATNSSSSSPTTGPRRTPRFAERVRPHVVGGRERRYLWLQPEDGPRLAEATRLAVETALAHPAWRVSVQTHKILDID